MQNYVQVTTKEGVDALLANFRKPLVQPPQTA